MDIPVGFVHGSINSWIKGSVGDYLFEAKVSEEPFKEAYRNGRVYKFLMTDTNKKFIALYDRKIWAEGKLNKEQRACFLAVVKAIEQIDFRTDERFKNVFEDE